MKKGHCKEKCTEIELSRGKRINRATFGAMQKEARTMWHGLDATSGCRGYVIMATSFFGGHMIMTSTDKLLIEILLVLEISAMRMFFLLIIHDLSPRAEAKWGSFLAHLITIFIVELRVCKQDRRICSSVVLEAARPRGQAVTHWEDELQCLAFCVRGSLRVTETDDLRECKSLQTSAIHDFTKILLVTGNIQGPFSRPPP